MCLYVPDVELGYLLYKFLYKLVPSKYADSAVLLFGTLFVISGVITGMHASEY